jgi:hypothetical protein
MLFCAYAANRACLPVVATLKAMVFDSFDLLDNSARRRLLTRVTACSALGSTTALARAQSSPSANRQASGAPAKPADLGVTPLPAWATFRAGATAVAPSENAFLTWDVPEIAAAPGVTVVANSLAPGVARLGLFILPTPAVLPDDLLGLGWQTVGVFTISPLQLPSISMHVRVERASLLMLACVAGDKLYHSVREVKRASTQPQPSPRQARPLS